MRPENYVAFFTVCGFFIGLSFSIVSIDGGFEILVFTCLITFVFYILVHISIMNFVDINKISGRVFNKEKYEETSNSLINDLSVREKKMETLLERLNEERDQLSKASGKGKRRNARKRAV